MALSTELLRRLDIAEEPLPKRLKLAENVFCSADLPITRKEDLIVQWLCKIAPTESDVWKTLKSCLDSGNLNTRATLKPEVKKVFIETLHHRFQNDASKVSNEMLECCSWVFSNAGMQHYFKNRPEEFGLLLESVFRGLSKPIKRDLRDLKSEESSKPHVPETFPDIDEKPKHTAHSCALNAIESIVQTYKNSLDKDLFAVVFLEHVLSPLCSLIDTTCTDSSNRLGAETHKCIQQIIFGKARHNEYKEFNGGNKDAVPAKLFSTLARLLDSVEFECNISTVRCVFRAAVGSYKTDTPLIDDIFRNLVNCAEKSKIQVLNALFEFLKDITLEFDNKIGEVTLSAFFQNIIQEILSKNQLSRMDYEVFRGIAELNPLIIESKVSDILKKVLLEEKTLEGEEDAYIKLMTGILDASTRLRREQKIIPWLLMSLKESLAENKKCSLKAKQIFPKQFSDKFTTQIGGLTSSQIIAMLRTLTHHLKTDCVLAIEGKSPNEISLMGEATVELLQAFFRGVRMFENNVSLASQDKFVSALGDLGNVLSAITEKTLNMKHDKRIIVVLLTAVLSWSEIQSLLEYYAPKSNAHKLVFPISADQWQQLVQRVTNFGEEGCKHIMNKLLLHRIKVSLMHEPQVKLAGLIGGLECSWPLILEHYPHIIPLLNSDQISELASLVLTDMVGRKSSLHIWTQLLSEENLQENRSFVTALLCQVFVQIGLKIEPSVTKKISACINVVKIIKAEARGSSIPGLEDMKGLVDGWSLLKETDSNDIRHYLTILLHLPLVYLSPGLRILTFLMTYAIRREFDANQEIADLCDEILLDALEDGSVDIFDFIEPTSLVSWLPKIKVLPKVFELSLRKFTSYEPLEKLTAVEVCTKEAAPVFLTCIEKVKPKLNVAQKVAFKDVEKVLSKLIVRNLGQNLSEPEEVRNLTLALKAAIGSGKVKKSLKVLVKATLNFIFIPSNGEEQVADGDAENKRIKLIDEGLELAVEALRHGNTFKVHEEVIGHIWPVLLKRPHQKLLIPLLGASIPKVFNELMISLHIQTVNDMQQSDGLSLENTLVIWHCIIKTDMGGGRSKSRLTAIRKLLQSLQISDVPRQHWPSFIKLLNSIVSSKHMHLSGENLDMMVLVGAKSIREGEMIACDDVLVLCLNLLRLRVEIITDRLPALLLLYRQVVTLVVSETKREKGVVEKQRLGHFALNIEKVTNALVKLKKDMVRIGPYLIADLVHLFSEGALSPNVKVPLENCIVNLLSVCDPRAMALLSRVLPPATREIFKSLHKTYTKFYRYTGKI